MEQFSIQLGNYIYELDAISSGLKFPTTAGFNAKSLLQFQLLLVYLIKCSEVNTSFSVKTDAASTLRGANAGNAISELYLGTEPASTIPGSSASSSVKMVHLVSAYPSVGTFVDGLMTTLLDAFAYGVSQKQSSTGLIASLTIGVAESCEISINDIMLNAVELKLCADAIARSLRKISDMDSHKITEFDSINMDELCFIER